MKFQEKTEGILEADLTPMIDMTFQLIAFFMILINFSKAEQDQRIMLPQSELAKPPEHELEHFITVQLTKNAGCIIKGQEEPLSDRKNDAVEKILKREAQLIENENAAVADTTIIIRAHKEVATEKVQLLIEKCQNARFEKFVLRAKEKK